MIFPTTTAYPQSKTCDLLLPSCAIVRPKSILQSTQLLTPGKSLAGTNTFSDKCTCSAVAFARPAFTVSISVRRGNTQKADTCSTSDQTVFLSINRETRSRNCNAGWRELYLCPKDVNSERVLDQGDLSQQGAEEDIFLRPWCRKASRSLKWNLS